MTMHQAGWVTIRPSTELWTGNCLTDPLFSACVLEGEVVTRPELSTLLQTPVVLFTSLAEIMIAPLSLFHYSYTGLSTLQY